MTRSARRDTQIAWFQVALALALLVVFGVSFGILFEYAALAVQSLEADIYGPTYCTIVSAGPVRNIMCDSGLPSQCYVVRALPESSEREGDGDVAATGHHAESLVLYPYYRDYYINKDCSYTLCEDNGGVVGRINAARRNKLDVLKSATDSSPLAEAPLGEDGVGSGAGRNVTDERRAAAAATGVVTTALRCWLDRRKPDRAFLGLNEVATAAGEAHDDAEGNGTSLVFSKETAYAVLVVPPIAILACLASLVACIVAGKVKADEVHKPVVSPNHIQINGKWYAPRPRPAALVDDPQQRRRQEAEKWQALRAALNG